MIPNPDRGPLIVPESHRNCGESLGLEHPYICGYMMGRYRVWHRHTGEVVFTSEEPNECLAQHEVRRKCHELNGVPEHPSPEVLAEIDATP